MSNRCRLCREENLNVCLTLVKAPRNISRLLAKNDLHKDKTIDLKVYRCQECGFVQLTEGLDEHYYDDYVMTVSHSSQMRNYQQAQALNFIKEAELVNKRVIEIGCGDGNYLEYMLQAGADVVGIEPSASFRKLATSRGFTVFSGYVSSQDTIPHAPYDGFVTRQVLEHVPDPNDFLKGIRLALKNNAVGLVEVPSLEQSFEKSRFYDFFPDHLNYFSTRTLRYALERNGFLVLDMKRGMNGEYLEAFVKVDRLPDFVELQASVNVLSRDINELIVNTKSTGKRIAVWGAGAKGITVLALINAADVAYVIDSDPYKQGLFTPVSHLPIVGPEHLIQEPVDVVIVMAMAYLDEIISQIKNDYSFKGTVAFLGSRLQVIEGD